MNSQAVSSKPNKGQLNPARAGLFTGSRTILYMLIVNVLVAGTAFFKDVYLAAYLGTTRMADAFNFAYFVPDSIANGILAAALAVSCVPVFSRRLAQSGTAGLRSLVVRVAWRSVVGSAVVTLVCLGFGQVLIGRLVGAQGLAHLAWPLFAIMAPTILLYPLVAVYAAALQATGRFIISVMPPLVLNTVVFTSTVVLLASHRPPQPGSRLISWFVLAGVAGMAAVVWVAWVGRPKHSPQDPGSTAALAQLQSPAAERKLWTMFAWYLLYMAATQCIGFVERALAARQPTGTIAGLTYAWRITQFPIWVYVAALCTFILPTMSRALVLGQTAAVRQSLLRALKYCGMVCLPTMVLFYMMRVPLIGALLGHGAFGTRSVALTAGLLSAYVWMILGQAVLLVCLRYFLAAGVLSWPVLASVLSAALNIGLDAALAPHLGGRALGIGASIGSTFNALLLLHLAGRHLQIRWRACIRPGVRLLGANAALAIFIVAGRLAYERLGLHSPVAALAGIACLVVLLAGIYAILLRQFRLFQWPMGEVKLA